jgi:hypothetical protein
MSFTACGKLKFRKLLIEYWPCSLRLQAYTNPFSTNFLASDHFCTVTGNILAHESLALVTPNPLFLQTQWHCKLQLETSAFTSSKLRK